jgi:hypothetical protein
VSRFSRKCGSLDVSQPYERPRPVTGIALPFFISNKQNDIDVKHEYWVYINAVTEQQQTDV